MRKNSLFNTYVVLNILLVLIPILVFSLMIYSNAYEEISAEVHTMQSFALDQAVHSVDNTINGFLSMSIYASSDPDLTPFLLNKGGYSTITALRRLGTHTMPTYVNNVYIFIDNKNMLYSPSGNISLDFFLQLHSFNGNWDQEDLIDLFRNPVSCSVSPPGCTISKRSVREEEFVVLAAP